MGGNNVSTCEKNIQKPNLWIKLWCDDNPSGFSVKKLLIFKVVNVPHSLSKLNGRFTAKTYK